jgi:hypothetical protein
MRSSARTGRAAGSARPAEQKMTPDDRIDKLEELVELLLVVYYNQDDDKIRELRRELSI